MSEERRDDLRRATLTGVRWIALARVIVETTALASTIALARMIPPAEFGRAAIALIVVALAAVIGPAGLTAPLVQRRSVEPIHLESAAFLSIVAGIVFTAATLALARTAFRDVFGAETAGLLALASPAWVITALGAASQSMLQRELRFRRIALLDSIPVLLGALTAVVLAVTGLDAKALVAGGLVTVSATTVGALASFRPPLPRPSRRGVGEIGGFASRVALSSFVYSLFRNVDYAILGARLNPVAVGYYWRAYQLGVDYQSKISQIMLRVSFPVFSRAESLDELQRIRTRIVRTHATVIVPLLAAFVAMAPELVPWVFGATWEPSVRPAQIMAVAGMAYAIATGTGPLMVAVARPGALLVWNVCELVLYAVLVFVLAPYGLTAVAIGVAAFATGSLLVIQVFLLGRYVGLPVSQLWHDVRAGVVVGAAVLGALTPVRMALEGDAPTIVVLFALGVVAVVVYVVALRALFREAWADLVSIVRRVGGGGPRAAAEAPAG